MIKVREHIPTFVDGYDARETVVEDEADICFIDWLNDKLKGSLRKDVRIERDKWGGFVSKRYDREWFVVATFKDT